MNSLPIEVLRGHESILLVDDEESLVKTATLLLEKLGYKVLGLMNSMEALETFGRNPDAFDLVITDQIMPQMSGVELAMRMLNIRPAFPLILCSGLVDSITLKMAKAHGFREFLERPLLLYDLAMTVRRVLDEKK